MIIWASDPGLRGAIVVIDQGKITHIVRMPLKSNPNMSILKNKINVYKLNKMLAELPLPDKTIIELPEVINTNARLTIASLFQSIGIVEGVMSNYCHDIRFVNPRRWQARYNLIKKTKWDSIAVANKIYPELKIELVKDSDVSEAALIGHWFLKYSGVFI